MTEFTDWRKSSYSGDSGDCVEIAVSGDRIGMRDSKNPDGGHLVLTKAQFAELLTQIKDGDLLT